MTFTPPPALVIFDCDGVLVNSEVVAARVLARELTAIGFALTAEECIARYTGISMRSVVERIEAEWGQRVRLISLNGCGRATQTRSGRNCAPLRACVKCCRS